MSDKPHEAFDVTRIIEVGPNDVFVFRASRPLLQKAMDRFRSDWTARFGASGAKAILLEPGVELEGVYRKVD